MPGDRVVIDVVAIEFYEGGNTIWVHSPTDGTILRIKCTGKIVIDPKCSNNIAHADVQVDGDIVVCIPEGCDQEGVDAHG